MIKTFKTIQPVEVDSRTGKSAEVFVEIGDVVFNGIAYDGRASYFYKDENDARVPIENVTATFTVEEAQQLEAQGALDGNTLTEKFVSLIVRATLYQFETEHYYGIGAADWEVYVAPEPEPEPEPVIEPEEENQDPGV